MTNDEITTEKAVEEVAMLGDEHLEAVAALGADISEVKEEEDECGLEPGGLPGGDSEEDIGDDNGETQRGTAQMPDRDDTAPAGGDSREDVRGLEDTGADDPAEPQGAQESPEETAEEGQKDTSVIAEAVKKIKGWKHANKHPYAMLICDHLIKRCREDGGFAEDVLRVDKTWDGCIKHIRSKAQRQASNGMAVIEESVVYEWAEDYIRGVEEPAEKPDKGAKKTIKVPKRNKNAQSATKNAQSEQKEPAPEVSTPKAPEAVAEPAKEKPKARKPKPKAPKAEKPKKEKKEKKPKDAGMEGQMDLFSLFG